MKIDPYNHKEKYLKWKQGAKERGILNISKYNSDLILQYIEDMEMGINIASGSVKGSRSYIRLNTLAKKLSFFARKLKEYIDLDKITEVTDIQVCRFFANMSNGTIKKKNAKAFQSTACYVKIFKAFWHWWTKVNRKKGISINDVTTDLDISQAKPRWVYLSEEQIRKLCENANFDYKILIMFLFDTGIRAPTELMNIKVSDFYRDFKELNIRDEISKTFGRRIKLMICSDLIKEYIKVKGLNQDSYLFTKTPGLMNRYIKRLSKRLFGDGNSLGGEKYSKLTMYDFRHCSCCYWLPRYKSESALKFRFGWKKEKSLNQEILWKLLKNT